MKIDSSDLLIAPPHIPDPRFRKTVLMLTHDHRGGSFALCVNRPTEHSLQDIIGELGIDTNLNFPLYWGGPVNPTTVWMLHDSGWECEHTVPVNDEWSMTSNVEMFRDLAHGNYPKHFRLMLGYCSWSKNQLQSEIDGMPPWSHKNSWLIAKNLGPEWLFEQPVELLWENCTTLCSHQAVDQWL
jgi:putative transcriptional regulator